MPLLKIVTSSKYDFSFSVPFVYSIPFLAFPFSSFVHCLFGTYVVPLLRKERRNFQLRSYELFFPFQQLCGICPRKHTGLSSNLPPFVILTSLCSLRKRTFRRSKTCRNCALELDVSSYCNFAYFSPHCGWFVYLWADIGQLIYVPLFCLFCVYMCLISGLESREYGRRDKSRWPRVAFYPQKLALTSPTSRDHSVGIVRSWTHATELSFF
jgi:hypothetical protein